MYKGSKDDDEVSTPQSIHVVLYQVSTIQLKIRENSQKLEADSKSQVELLNPIHKQTVLV